MRYSFHGKVRATGQQVDGYVEAETSTEAIDRLADQGIIGVYSVRAEPKQPRNPVLLAGTPEFDRAQFEDPASAAKKGRRSLPAPPPPMAPLPYLPLTPLPAMPQPPVAAPAEPVAVAAAPSVLDSTMLQVVAKLDTLIGQMQKFLDRPAQVVYASGGGGTARSGGGGGKRSASRNISDAQNSTLKDIFQNNLDLRRSLQKLADTVTPSPNGNPVPDTAVPAIAASAPSEEVTADAGSDSGADEPPPPDGGSSVDLVPPVEATSGEPAGDELGDLPLRAYESDHARQAQPAA